MGRSKHSGKSRQPEDPASTYKRGKGDAAGAVGRAASKLKGRKEQLKRQECTAMGMSYDPSTGTCK